MQQASQRTKIPITQKLGTGDRSTVRDASDHHKIKLSESSSRNTQDRQVSHCIKELT